MARGWESKSVEAQQEERTTASAKAPALTPEQTAAAQERQRLTLELAMAEQALTATTHPARRHALEAAIASLRDQLSKQ